MDFEYPEDKQYFIDLLADGNEELFKVKYKTLFDFRDPTIKRQAFNKIRNKIIKDLITRNGERCKLHLVDDCEIDKNLVVDHYIPLSTNELNKKLRGIKAELGKKVSSQSFGSNHINNFILACSRCNSFKKHKIIKQDYALLDTKQLSELSAVTKYIRFLEKDSKPEYFIFPEQTSPVDIIYFPDNIKIQVTSFDGGPNKLLRRGNYKYGISLDKIIDEYILKPIDKKLIKYGGGGVNEIILLIHGVTRPGWVDLLEKDIRDNRAKIADIVRKSGFKSVYLVFDMNEDVIPVYVG